MVTLERVSLDDLIGLFVGDDETTGYASPLLVIQICRRVNPPTTQALKERLFPNTGWDALSDIYKQALDDGYRVWNTTGRRREL